MSCLDKLRKINDLCLFVNDFENSLKFYVEKFGFKVIRLQPDEENPNYVQFEFAGTSLTMWQRDGFFECVDRKYVEGEGHPFMIAVKVPSLDDVDEITDELKRRGAECIGEPRTFKFGSRASYFKDYEGNIWEVFAWEEGDGPGLLEQE